jgi:hypothetical protein
MFHSATFPLPFLVTTYPLKHMQNTASAKTFQYEFLLLLDKLCYLSAHTLYKPQAYVDHIFKEEKKKNLSMSKGVGISTIMYPRETSFQTSCTKPNAISVRFSKESR